MKKVAIYARSAVKDNSLSRGHQLGNLKRACKNYKVVREYVDNGKGSLGPDRPALKRLQEDAEKGLFDTVYVSDPNRFSRNASELIKILKDLGKKGIEVNFLRPVDDFQFSILTALSEFDARTRSEAISKGLAKARAN